MPPAGRTAGSGDGVPEIYKVGSFSMGKSKRLSAEERLEAIRPIIEGLSSPCRESKITGIHHTTLRDWMRKYESDGLQGLENGKGWKQYSEEVKLNAVKDVLEKGISKRQTIKKYGISDSSVLTRWIKGYNGGNKLESTSTGRVGAIMNKGRKTTFEERIEITEFTIARNKDYKEAMEKYKVSYQQAYSWVKAYEKQGHEGLVDRRGKKPGKEESELSETEKLKLRVKQLEARHEFLEMQDAFAKKLMELEQRSGRFH
jgi:transposase